MRWHAGYAAVTVALLATEIAIALFVRDSFVRPHLGDAIAVALVYAGLRAVTRWSVPLAALAAFAVAVVIEGGQYVGVLDRIGLGDNRIARVVLGTGFDPVDFVAYAGGAVAVLLVERYRRASRAMPGTRTVSPPSDSSSRI